METKRCHIKKFPYIGSASAGTFDLYVPDFKIIEQLYASGNRLPSTSV